MFAPGKYFTSVGTYESFSWDDTRMHKVFGVI